MEPLRQRETSRSGSGQPDGRIYTRLQFEHLAGNFNAGGALHVAGLYNVTGKFAHRKCFTTARAAYRHVRFIVPMRFTHNDLLLQPLNAGPFIRYADKRSSWPPMQMSA